MNKGIRILHTSDLQLDAPFLFLGEGGQRHRQQIRKTFAAIVEMAQREAYQMLLMAGDLFNSNRPSQSTVDAVLRLLGKVSMPICILPGNHDPYDERSIYRRVTFPSNVTIFTDNLTSKIYPTLDLAIYGNAITSKDGGKRPLADIRPHLKARWHVAMAHGSVITGLAEKAEQPIYPKEIEDCRMDYVALGDWHSFADHSQGLVRATYCGAPEPTAYDQEGAGFVSKVTLDEQGVQVEKIRVGKIHTQQVHVNVTGQNEVDIQDLILDHAGEDRMVDVILTGLAKVGTVIDPAELEMLLSQNFYTLRVRNQSHPQMDDISLADYPSGHLIRRYIQIMVEHLQQAQDNHRADIAEQALQLGVALLHGKDVI
jgi:exonuclease SbcD